MGNEGLLRNWLREETHRLGGEQDGRARHIVVGGAGGLMTTRIGGIGS